MPEENGTEKKPYLKFCRLCGKHKPPEEFLVINLGSKKTSIGMIIFETEGCHNCSVVVHNAIQILQEAMAQAVKKIAEQGPKIIQPTLIAPRDLKKS